LSVKETGLVPVSFVSESDKMLVTFIFGIGERVTIVLPIFFYHNSDESLPRLGLGRVVTPSAISGDCFCQQNGICSYQGFNSVFHR